MVFLSHQQWQKKVHHLKAKNESDATILKPSLMHGKKRMTKVAPYNFHDAENADRVMESSHKAASTRAHHHPVA